MRLLFFNYWIMKNQVLEKKVAVSFKISREEAELIKKALHLQEVSICEVFTDNKKKYLRQLGVIRNLHKKIEEYFI